MKRPLRLLAGLAVAGGLLAGWSFGVEPGWLAERELTLPVAAGPGQQPVPALSVAFLSDLHVGAPHWDLEAVAALVERINAARPDLILLGGDFVHKGLRVPPPVPMSEIAPVLGRLQAPLGVIAVLGNHDWWWDGEEVRAALDGQGIRVLENQGLLLEKDGRRLWLAGLADDSTRRPWWAGAVAGRPQRVPVLALAHDPGSWPEVPDEAILTLAGHTHGGQVYLPFFGAPVVPGRSDRRLAYGLAEQAGRRLYVTSGIGTSILGIRLNMRPEWVLLRLRPVADGQGTAATLQKG